MGVARLQIFSAFGAPWWSSMGGHSRLWHPKWFTRYLWGGIAAINLTGFIADQQTGINRCKNPDIMWPWWHEIMRKKENGEIPYKMPGYMLSKYRNEPEERWTAKNIEEGNFADY